MSPRAAIRIVSFLSVILGSAVSVPAAQLKEAQVTQVVKDVKLLPTGAAARPATVNDEVRDGIAVRTGADSRSELKFTDQTLARLGSNTLFSFSEGTRNLNLQDGAMLLRVPKGAGGAKINSSAVTAAITGTTVMLETHASTTKNKNSYYKFIVLEGTARLYLPGRMGESTLVKAGQMIIMRLDSKTIPEPVDVDISKITQSSLLVTGFSTPLGSEALIAFEKTKQNEQKNSGQLIETNLVIYGGGTNVVLADPNTVDVAVSAESSAAKSPAPTPTPTPIATPTPVPTPTPSATPTKFGTPSPITSPVPYVITSGTTISTDPSITTNGVTDFGKIYRGPETDGPASAWAFGSTSTFDTSSGFDSRINTSGAAFKFTALQLAGNPTISTANGEINLGLIAVNGITSGPPGGPLTFSGIRGLLLATQNGPIDLGSEISFSGLHYLTVYAR
jgi:FecR protein